MFDVQRRTVDSSEVLSVVGDVDLATLPELAAAITELLGPGRVGSVTLDLAGVDYIDPVCLGVLVNAGLRSRRAGGDLTVVASGPVRELLAETRLDEILAVAPA